MSKKARNIMQAEPTDETKKLHQLIVTINQQVVKEISQIIQSAIGQTYFKLDRVENNIGVLAEQMKSLAKEIDQLRSLLENEDIADDLAENDGPPQ